jgi:acetamidase/formamidase
MIATHVPARPDSLRWGRLPAAGARPVAQVNSGDLFTVDTLSHEGALEDQGRDPLAFFARHGIAAQDVLPDLCQAASELGHDPASDGPHLVTGPIYVTDARPGDLLQVDIVALTPRTPYGVITDRHAKDVFAPEPDLRPASAGPANGGLLSTFCRVHDGHAELDGDARLRIALAPFLGIIGTAVAGTDEPHSGPPGRHGGNIDLRHLVAGTSLYLPVFVPGALLYVGDPHFVQGNGELASTALEAPLWASLRVQLHRGDGDLAPAPLARTASSWIVCGLDRDLNRAVRFAAANATDLLARAGVSPALTLPWLSVAADVEVTQVVDGVVGAHVVLPHTPGLDLVPYTRSEPA